MNTVTTAVPMLTAEYMSEAAKALPTGLYIGLFHGRDDPTADMDDWGFNGPMIPVIAVHGTYMSNLRLHFANIDHASEFSEKSHGEVCDDEWQHVAMNGDLISYDGKFYGDFSIQYHVQGAEVK